MNNLENNAMKTEDQTSDMPLVLVVDDDPSTFLAIRRIGISEKFETFVLSDATPLPSKVMRRPYHIVFDSSYAGTVAALTESHHSTKQLGICLCRHGHLLNALKSAVGSPFVFVEKPFSIAKMTDLLRKILHSAPHQVMASPASFINRVDKLTVREKDIFKRMSLGFGCKFIADDLGISIKTVYVHRANIMQKIGCRTVTDLTRVCALYSAQFGSGHQVASQVNSF